MGNDYPEISQEAREAARAIRTTHGDQIEAQAIEIAAGALDMDPVQTAIIGALIGQQFRNTEGRNAVRYDQAVLEVRQYFEKQGRNLQGEEADLILQKAVGIVRDRVAERQH